MSLSKHQSLGEEIANAVSHGVGALLGLAGLIAMLLKSRGPAQIAGSCIFGIGIIILYTMSTLYHAFRDGSVAKRVFKRFDHVSIYVLIGSTYSPILILVAPKPLGWILLAVQWTLIIVGIVFKAVFIRKADVLHLALYLLLGWSGVTFFGPLYAYSATAFWLILGGGIAYTLGVLFYAFRLFKYSHFVWHIFVILGTLLHFLAIFLFYLG